MRIIYTFFIYCYTFIVRMVSPFNAKAKLWVSGRRHLLERIAASLKNEKQPLIWIHASSLGEFEQGRPVIEKIKDLYPHYKIMLTFFSPSGYEIRKNYNKADYIFYLPADTLSNAKKFISLTKPKIAVFVKYEYWFNYLNQLNKKGIPVFYISSIFRNNHYFFKFYGCWALSQLKKVNYFFVQNEISKNILNNHGISNVIISGDTRFDRVMSIASQNVSLPVVSTFVQNSKVIILGSSWPKDDSLFIGLIKTNIKGVKFIIAPHEINTDYIKKLLQTLGSKACTYSMLNEENAQKMDIVVIDGIGYLSALYRYAHLAYIGGGFGKGIHNILEAACFGLPVIFGPNYQKFSEAVELINKKGAFSISEEVPLIRKVNELLNDDFYFKATSEICISFVNSKSGATDKILNKLSEYI